MASLGLRKEATSGVRCLFRLQSQLSTRSLDVVAFLATQGRWNAFRPQRRQKFFLTVC